MTLKYVEHVLLWTRDVEKTADWYCDVLGFERGPHPDFRIPVEWLYIGDQDVLHIGQIDDEAFQKEYLGGRTSEADAGTGVIDHVCFRCTDITEVIARLEDKGVDFLRRQVGDQGLYQLFMEGPDGVKVELNFTNEEARAAGLTAEFTAGDVSTAGNWGHSDAAR